MKEDIATIKTEIQHLSSGMEEIKHKIIGDGQDGLCVRVDRIEQQNAQTEKRKEITWKEITGIATIVGIVFTIGNAVLNHFKF